jgi:uncharacterized tellurite resistance protein B-like protein
MKVPEIQNLDDFTCYLLTYVAEADMRVTPEEKELILQHVTPEKYERIKRFIDNRSDYQNLQLIDYYRGEFVTTAEQREKLLEEMSKIAQADDKVKPMEHYMIRALRKMFLT